MFFFRFPSLNLVDVSEHATRAPAPGVSPHSPLFGLFSARFWTLFSTPPSHPYLLTPTPTSSPSAVRSRSVRIAPDTRCSEASTGDPSVRGLTADALRACSLVDGNGRTPLTSRKSQAHSSRNLMETERKSLLQSERLYSNASSRFKSWGRRKSRTSASRNPILLYLQPSYYKVMQTRCSYILPPECDPLARRDEPGLRDAAPR